MLAKHPSGAPMPFTSFRFSNVATFAGLSAADLALLETRLEPIETPRGTLVVKEGDPKRVLIEEAEQWGADCIFVGARGLRRLERFLLGSVSTAVAARAHCSVEVVHPRLSL